MNVRAAKRLPAALLAILFVFAWQTALLAARPPVVQVTIRTEASNLRVGQTTKAHVFAKIDPAQAAITDQIFSWYVDLLNSSNSVVQIDAATILTPFSDSDPATSSKGIFDGTNLHGIYNTMLNQPGAGHDAEIELFNLTLKAAGIGKATFSVGSGTGNPALDHDFIVAGSGTNGVFYGGDYSLATVAVTSFLNTPPTLDAISDVTIDEGSQFTVTVAGHDTDAGQKLSYSLLGTVPAGASINSTNGLFSWTPAENQGPTSYHFSVQVTDNGTPAMTATNDFNVTVREVNTAPTVLVPVAQTRPELVAITLTCAATDSDIVLGQTPATNRFTFSLVNPPAGASINTNSGVFTWTPTEDQGPGDYQIQVVVTDDGDPVLVGANSFVIHVTEVNRPPTLQAPANQSVPELSAISLSFTGSDPDLPANPLSYQLLQAPPGVIIDTATGVIDWTPTEAQGPGSYTILVAVSDNQSPPLVATNSMVITVTELNTAPTLDLIPDRTVNELATLTVNAVAHDVDLPAQTLTYSLENPPTGAVINTNTGAISWTPTESQGPGRYTFAVRVTDNGSPAKFDVKSFDVTVNEVNTRPAISVAGGQTNLTVVELSVVTVNFTATDADLPANLISFTLLDPPLGATIDPVSGVFSWTPTESQGPGSYTIKVVATDNGVPPLSATNSVQITVTETNSPPVLNPISDRTIAELSKLTVNITAIDSDIPAQTLAFSLDSAPSGAAINSTNGVFTWTPAENQGPGQYTIAVRVRETTGGSLFATNSFKVTVTEVNSAPVVQVPSALSRPEMSLISVNITALDSDIVLGAASTSNHVAFSLLNPPDGASIDATTGLFSWTPTESQGPATYQIKIVATDDGVPPLSGTNTLTINVTEVNLPPTITAPTNQVVIETTPMAVSFQASDPDLPANKLTFSLVSAPVGVLLNATNGAVTWTPTEAQGPGTYTITVAVSDDGSPSLRATNSFNVSVLETNSPPVLAAILDRNATPLVALNVQATATDPDIPAQTLRYSLDVAPAGATINTNTGAFTWTPSEGQGPGNYNITIRVTEVGGQALFDTKTFRIAVSAPNLAPVLSNPADREVVAGATILVTNVATDADVPANTLTFAIVSAPSGATINGSSGVLTWTTTLSNVGTNLLQVKVTDNGVPARSATNNFKIIVRAPNTAPVLLNPADQDVLTGATVLVTNLATDVDANFLTYAIVSAPTTAAINPFSGMLAWTPLTGDIGTNILKVKVTDNGSPALSATNTFKIIVHGPNTAPILQTPADLEVIAGSPVILTNIATDANLDTLTFGTVSGPPGWTIGASSGVVNWSPGTDDIGTNIFQVKVTDNGFPPLSATNLFRVIVKAAATTNAPPTLKAISVAAGGFTLQLNGQASTAYILEFSTNLTAWSTLTTITLGATETNKTYLDTAHGPGQKIGFYRVKTGAAALPSAPTLRAVSANASGFTIRVTGDANAAYRLEWTTNFTTWNNLTSVTLNSGTSLDYLDTTHNLTNQRIFFRAAAP